LRARTKAIPPSGKITISVASRVAHVDMIHAISDQVAALVGFGEDDILNLGLAVREAAINAIKHGNRLDPKKRVRVVFEFSETGLSVAIKDRGDGFDMNAVKDPTLPENLFRSSGRGLLLMKAFVDRVEVHGENGQGSEVYLYKSLASAPAPSRDKRQEG
jgi:serine/threonine-protein kinase RsbW